MPSAVRTARRRRTPARRGVVTIWTLICLPLAVIVLFGMVHVGRMWHARVQLENAVEAAALAAVQEWGDQGGGTQGISSSEAAGRAMPRPTRCLVFRSIWPIARAPLRMLGPSDRPCPGGTGFDFTPDPDAKARFAVILQATVRVPRLFRPLLGESTVTATTVAYYDPSTEPRRPRLIWLNADQPSADPLNADTVNIFSVIVSPCSDPW